MKDLLFALRQFRRSPGFTSVAVLTLALGIGANTAIFSLLNAVWMRALPVSEPHQLRLVNWSGHNVKLSHFVGGRSNRSYRGAQVYGSFPYPVYKDFDQRVPGCSDIFAFFPLSGLTLGGIASPTTVDALMVSGNFFRGYGAGVSMGRPILPSDDVPGSAPVAVVTHRFWERECGLDPEILGRVITINQHAFTIIGVLPQTFCGPEVTDSRSMYVPMSAQPMLASNLPLEARDCWWVRIMARLDSTADETQVATRMKGLFLQTLSAPGQGTRADQPDILVEDGSRGLLGVRRMMALSLTVILGAVVLVLVIACANLAGLLLARGSVREHELSVRAALGAGRTRLIRQLLTESFVLCFSGAVLGCLLAVWVQSLVSRFVPETLGGFRIQTGLDFRVLLFASVLVLLTTVLCGLLPALRVTRLDLCLGLKSGQVSSVPNLRLGRALVVGQVSLSVLLIIASGLLLRTFVNLSQVDLGFDPDQVLVFRVNPGQAGLGADERMQFYDQVRDAVQALPGVHNVALSQVGLLAGSRTCSTPSFPTREPSSEPTPMSDMLDVSEGFFGAMKIPLLRGRDFNRADVASDSRATIVNRAFAETFFPNEDPLGQWFSLGGEADCRIVGVCGDAKYDRPQRSIEPTIYLYHRQTDHEAMTFAMRTSATPLSLAPGIRKAVAGLNRAIPLEDVSTLSQLLTSSIAPEKLLSALGVGLALLGLTLSSMGIYGLLTYMIARRRSEIGVRLALGALPGDIARSIVGNALRLAGKGLLFGLPVALGLSQILRGTLFEVAPHDPLTITVSTLLVLSLATVAAWIPARRAAKVDPMVALRTE